MASSMVEDPNFQEDQLASLTTEDIIRASRILDNEIRILKVSSTSFYFYFLFISVFQVGKLGKLGFRGSVDHL